MKSRKILIVEDDPVTARAHRNRLAREGYEVEIAEDGQKALDRLPHLQPDAVLLDLQLPGLSGLEVLKSVRASEEFRNLPIFVFTGNATPQMVDSCIRAGANRIFEKWCLTAALLLDELGAVFQDSPRAT